MTTYVLFHSDSETLYVRAADSAAALRWAQTKFPGLHIISWAVATSTPRWTTIHTA